VALPKRRYDPDTTREDILDAAERLFAEHGFGDVPTSRIAREAGVSQSQIHYHFETKRKLWGAVFQRRFAEYFAVQSRMLDNAEMAGSERMRASIEAYFGFFRANPRFVKLLGRSRLDAIEENNEWSMSAELMRRGAEVISESQKNGELRNDVPAEFILIGFLSLVAEWFLSRDQYLSKAGVTGDFEHVDDQYLDFILKVYLRGISR
jgi:AcrR family transcriptional regulator